MLYQSSGTAENDCRGISYFSGGPVFVTILPGREDLNYGSGTKAVTMTVRGEFHQLYLVFVVFAGPRDRRRSGAQP